MPAQDLHLFREDSGWADAKVVPFVRPLPLEPSAAPVLSAYLLALRAPTGRAAAEGGLFRELVSGSIASIEANLDPIDGIETPRLREAARP